MQGLFLLFVAWLAAQATPDSFTRSFRVEAPSEVIAVVRAGCARCAWGEAGREAAALRLEIDGHYSQHVMLVRGETLADYPVTLGALAAGSHRLTIARDPALSAAGAGPASIDDVTFTMRVPGPRDDYMAQSMAPILYARPNTVGHFTDLPLVMWYESTPTPGGRLLRYSVIFSNEDGGTATDRLMATWGRTTDIEFVYGVEIDDRGKIVTEQFQGPGHEVPPFRGRHEGAHPLLWVSTDNNMVSETGPTQIRYAPSPEPFDLRDVSREAVMDRQPWTYGIAAAEMIREGKIANNAAAGSGLIPDPRRYVTIEACTELENAAVAFSVRAVDGGVSHWYDADRGRSDFRIVRSGCFRGAVPLPESAERPDAIRFRAFSRPPQNDPAARPARVVVRRVNSMFNLDDTFLPRPSIFSWRGALMLTPDGDWRELPR